MTAQTISLLVKPDQVELITLAEEMGRIRLSMRGSGDEEVASTGGVTPHDLLNGSGSNRNQREESPPTTALVAAPVNPLLKIMESFQNTGPAPAEPEKQSHKITIILGPDVQEFEIDRDGGIAPSKPKDKDSSTPASAAHGSAALPQDDDEQK
jgi:hypothetical protein